VIHVVMRKHHLREISRLTAELLQRAAQGVPGGGRVRAGVNQRPFAPLQQVDVDRTDGKGGGQFDLIYTCGYFPQLLPAAVGWL